MAGKHDYFRGARRAAAVGAIVLATVALVPLALVVRELVAGDDDRVPGRNELAIAAPPMLVLFAAAATGVVTLLTRDPRTERRVGVATVILLLLFAVVLLNAESIGRSLS